MNDMTITRAEAVSFRGRKWQIPDAPRSEMIEFKRKGANPVLARILAARGLTAMEYDAFMKPTIRELMPDPFFLLDMEPGAKRIARAIRERERIGIWSDYDADGATSAGVLGRFLRMCGHDDFTVRIPDRIREGYGPNTPGLLDMKETRGCNLVCILDAGIVAFEPLSAAADAGMEIVVIDHHMAEDTIPKAVAVINPNRKDQKPGLGHLCAAGVSFIFAVAVARELRSAGYFDGKEGRPGGVPDLMELLDLVALGTVCDVVPLKTLNRAFVARGISYLSGRKTPGIAALALAAGIEPGDEIGEQACGWILGPRINAGGRIGDSASGALLLLEEDPAVAGERATALHEMNATRKEIEAAATEAAIAQMSGRMPGVTRTLALAIVDAHEGVVGISAGRLKEQFDAPAIVLTADHEGNLKGSARSIAGFDIGHAIIEARNRGLIIKGGGHGMAGGLTLTRAQVPGLLEFVNGEIAKTGYFRDGITTSADLDLRLKDLTVEVIQDIEGLRPFGTGNPEPVVILERVSLAETRILKEKHLKMVFRDGDLTIDGLMWNVVGTVLGDEILAAHGRTFDVLGKPQINEFRGRKSPQIMVEDLRFHAAALI
ncbi:single-stranded-DNA-specific exonuclease RecJ [Defluviimonas salinarum]|uniref:Single-stranded-DNA-specific exonuclease RecJ n=1 Tax=Defluviimonas salinarum TaxID=2992147 RepID=A0ABT3J9P9_9RHOB|nr:single-stranded-DNA-specific exonuclease RecJ [Defluviimonas salinarum]MCW3784426.1 single-stranded-DNA-specific exonuclease RecJ [Defluviimonas salinarum]